MSMHEVTYSGYGCDLGDINLKPNFLNDVWHNVYKLLTESDSVIYDCPIDYDNLTIAVPCSSDDFGLLILIPDRPAVILNKSNSTINHLLTKDEANHIIVKTALSLLDLIQPEAKLSVATYQDLRNSLSKAIIKENEYHYSNEYSDLV